jgi:hypothetical protein
MKKLNILLLTLSFALVSCEFDEGFEEMNVDPTASTSLDVNQKFTYLFLKTANDEFEYSYTEILCAGQLVQQVLDIQFPQSSIFSLREDLQTAAWDVAYVTTIKTVVDIIDQLEKDGNTGTEMGIARIMRAYVFHKIVDAYGDTPYFDAGKGYIDSNFRPVYDDAQLIYMDMLKELEEGVAQIDGSTTLGNADIIFGGDTAKWKKFGNSLMLRLAMRIKNVDAANSSAWVAKAIAGGVMSSSADTALMVHTNGPTQLNQNAWGIYYPRYAYARIGKTLYDWLQAKSDPRLDIIADPSNTYGGAPYGQNFDDLTLQGIDVGTLPYTNVNPAISKLDQPRMLLTYAQTAFVLAEHYGATGNHVLAETNYNAGVTSAMNQWALWDSSFALSAADISAYLTANPYDSANYDELIGDQFWVASFFDFYEAFANFRRTGFPALQPFGGNPAHPENLTSGQIPRRIIYNPNEANLNSENFNAMISSQGPNNRMTRVWWDN